MVVVQTSVVALVFAAATSPWMVSGEVCKWGNLPTSRVFDVQWSGIPSAQTEHMSGFNSPYHPKKGQVTEEPSNYYTLTAMANNEYQLNMFSADDKLAESFPPGKLKANGEAVFYIIEGWFGTLLTKQEHENGDSGTYRDMRTNPSSAQISEVLGECTHESSVIKSSRADVDTPKKKNSVICGNIPVTSVFDVQWSGRVNANHESARSFRNPYIPHQAHLVYHDDDKHYFTLTKTSINQYQLKYFRNGGDAVTTFPSGSVKASSNALMYIIEGWYGTVITKDAHNNGDSIQLEDLRLNPTEDDIKAALDDSCGEVAQTEERRLLIV